MKLTQTQRDKIYKLIFNFVFDNMYSASFINADDFERNTKLKRVNGILYSYSNNSHCDLEITREIFFHSFTVYYKQYNKRGLNIIKSCYGFVELENMPSKTLKDYFNHVKPQYIQHLESPEEFPLESIQIGFYI